MHSLTESEADAFYSVLALGQVYLSNFVFREVLREIQVAVQPRRMLVTELFKLRFVDISLAPLSIYFGCGNANAIGGKRQVTSNQVPYTQDLHTPDLYDE